MEEKMNLPRWNLKSLYENCQSEKIAQDLQILIKSLTDFEIT